MFQLILLGSLTSRAAARDTTRSENQTSAVFRDLEDLDSW